MTVTTADFVTDVTALRAQAAQVRFRPFLKAAIVWPFAAFFTVVGWAAGSLWYGAVLAALTMQYGFYKGAHLKIAPPLPASQQE